MGELIIAKLVNDAAAGDPIARREILRLMSESDESQQKRGITIVALDEVDLQA